MFPYVTTVPMIANAVGDNKSLVEEIQKRNTRVLKYQHTPLRFIQRWLDHPEQSLFDTIVVLQRNSLERSYDRAAFKWDLVAETANVDVSKRPHISRSL